MNIINPVQEYKMDYYLTHLDREISLVNKMIEYYSEKDDFEKCIVLKQTINRINTEINEF